VRARAKIREAAIPYQVPGPEHLPERTDAVLAVVYLLFTEGYAGGNEVVRAPPAEEAIRLARLLSSLMSDSSQLPEVLGLLALMLFQHSRAAARSDDSGDLVLLEDQDREKWDFEVIGQGVAALLASESARQRLGADDGPYQLQAKIAFVHATSPSFETTDFAGVAALYSRLARVAPTPVVNLQRAIAVGIAEGPDAGLALLDTLESAPLEDYHLFHAARADLLRRSGRAVEALPHYERALELASNDPERRFLARRIDALRTRSE
jgi:RNA polymerase sigma-70 factor (ECF subfamily)